VNDAASLSTQTALDERADVLARLWAEFDRLNRTFFDGALTLGEIKLSTRKQYGGYYHRGKNQIVLSWLAHTEHGWPKR
jgi:hypothetical protein